MEITNTREKQTRGSGGIGKGADYIRTFGAAYDNVKEVGREAERIAYEGIKVIMSETGVTKAGFKIVKSLDYVDTPSSTSLPYATPNRIGSYHDDENKGRINSEAKETRVGTSDSELLSNNDDASADEIFVCGNYFLPLNLVFSVNASKIVVQSQLVDGINIVERISKAARNVSCTFRIERNEEILSKDEESVFYIREFTGSSEDTPVKKVLQEEERKVLYKLTDFINNLYENEDVFKIVNPVLNNEFGINYCFIKSFSMNPSIGNTLCTINIQMQEVNVTDSLLFVEETTEKTKTSKQ